ncbi:MAG: DNA-3-methyladenine glycosylase I [Actinomycetota bacterium]|nr:DNA-3-methyladenine glycosylase I [Actinomycetota bacterium]
MPVRCPWAPTNDPEYLAYHDEEWGVPVHDEARLFEMLSLEGAQAGLSWSTILHKREGYRRAFASFDPKKVARFTPARVERLLKDPSIVRNRLKVESVVRNAAAILELGADGPLDAFVWSFVDGIPTVNRWKGMGDIPAETPASRAMSKELKRRGFAFVGPTVCYAFMQACGLVNCHVADCFRWAEVKELRRLR